MWYFFCAVERLAHPFEAEAKYKESVASVTVSVSAIAEVSKSMKQRPKERKGKPEALLLSKATVIVARLGKATSPAEASLFAVQLPFPISPFTDICPSTEVDSAFGSG